MDPPLEPTYDGAAAASTAEEMSSSLLRVLRASRELARAGPLVGEVRRNRLLHSEAPVADGPRLPRPDCAATARSKGREEGRRLQTLKTLPLAELGLKRRAFPRGGAESRRRRSSSADASRALSDTLLSTPGGRPDPLPPGSAFAPAKVQEDVLGVIGVDLMTAAADSAALALQPAAAVVHEDAGRSEGEREGENEGGKEGEKEGESEDGGGYDRRGDGDGSVAGGSVAGGSGAGQEAEPIVLPRSTPRGAGGGKRPRATGRRGREDVASSMFNRMPHSRQGIEVAAVRALRNPFARGPPGSDAASAASAAGARDGGGGDRDGTGTGNMPYSLGSPRSRPPKARPSPNLANRHHRRLTRRRGSSEDVPRNSAALAFTGDSAVDSTVDSPSSGGVVLFDHEPSGPAGKSDREQGKEEEGGGELSGGIVVQPAARTGWGDNADGDGDDDDYENKDKEDIDAAASSAAVSAAPGGREVVGIPPGLADMWIQVCDQVAVDEALIKSAELGQVELTWWDDHPEGGVEDAGSSSSSSSSSSSVDALQQRTKGSVLAHVAAVEDVPDGENDDEHDATNNDGSRRTSYLLVPDDPGAAAASALSDNTALAPANGTAQGTDRSIARPLRRRRIVTSGASARPRAFSLLFEGGDRSVYHWSPCRVLAVDHLRQRYLIRWGWDRGLTDDGNTRGRGIVGGVGDASGVDGQGEGTSQDEGGQSDDSDGDDAVMLALQKGPLPKGRKWVTRSNLRLRSESLETWEKQVALMSALQRRAAFDKGKRDILIDLSQRLDLRSPRPSSPVRAGVVGSSKGKGAGTRGDHNGDGDINGNGDNAVVVGTLSVASPPRDGRWGGNKASTIFLERERRAGPGLVEGPVSLPGEVHRRLHRRLFAACRSEHRHQHHHHHHHHHQQKQKSSTGIRDREANGQGGGILSHALRSLQFLLRSTPGMTAGTTDMASLASLASFASLASLRSDGGSPALEIGDETAAADGVASNVAHAGVRNLDLALGTARGGQNRLYDDEHEEVQQTDEQRADQQHQRRQQAERIMDLWEALEQEVREDYEIMQLVCALKTKYDELDLLGDDAPESLLRLGPILRCLQLRGTASSSSSSSVSASPFRGGLVDVYDGRGGGDGQNSKGGGGGVVVPFNDARTRRGWSDGERHDSPTPSSVENEGPTTADNNNEEERSDCASEDEDARLGDERVDAGGEGSTMPRQSRAPVNRVSLVRRRAEELAAVGVRFHSTTLLVLQHIQRKNVDLLEDEELSLFEEPKETVSLGGFEGLQGSRRIRVQRHISNVWQKKIEVAVVQLMATDATFDDGLDPAESIFMRALARELRQLDLEREEASMPPAATPIAASTRLRWSVSTDRRASGLPHVNAADTADTAAETKDPQGASQGCAQEPPGVRSVTYRVLRLVRLMMESGLAELVNESCKRARDIISQFDTGGQSGVVPIVPLFEVRACVFAVCRSGDAASSSSRNRAPSGGHGIIKKAPISSSSRSRHYRKASTSDVAPRYHCERISCDIPMPVGRGKKGRRGGQVGTALHTGVGESPAVAPGRPHAPRASVKWGVKKVTEQMWDEAVASGQLTASDIDAWGGMSRVDWTGEQQLARWAGTGSGSGSSSSSSRSSSSSSSSSNSSGPHLPDTGKGKKKGKSRSRTSSSSSICTSDVPTTVKKEVGSPPPPSQLQTLAVVCEPPEREFNNILGRMTHNIIDAVSDVASVEAKATCDVYLDTLTLRVSRDKCPAASEAEAVIRATVKKSFEAPRQFFADINTFQSRIHTHAQRESYAERMFAAARRGSGAGGEGGEGKVNDSLMGAGHEDRIREGSGGGEAAAGAEMGERGSGHAENHKSSNSLGEIQAEVKRHRADAFDIMTSMDTKRRFGLFLSDASEYKRTLVQVSTDIEGALLGLLSNDVRQSAGAIQERFNSTKTRLRRVPTTPEEMKELAEYIRHESELVQNMHAQVSETQRVWDVLDSLYYLLPKDVAVVRWKLLAIPVMTDKILTHSIESNRRIARRFKDALRQRTVALRQDIDACLAEFGVGHVGLFDSLATVDSNLAQISSLKDSLTTFKTAGELCNRHEKILFGRTVTDFLDVAESLSTLSPFDRLWSVAYDWTSWRSHWMQEVVHSLDVTEVVQNISQAKDTMLELRETFTAIQEAAVGEQKAKNRVEVEYPVEPHPLQAFAHELAKKKNGEEMGGEGGEGGEEKEGGESRSSSWRIGELVGSVHHSDGIYWKVHYADGKSEELSSQAVLSRLGAWRRARSEQVPHGPRIPPRPTMAGLRKRLVDIGADGAGVFVEPPRGEMVWEAKTSEGKSKKKAGGRKVGGLGGITLASRPPPTEEHIILGGHAGDYRLGMKSLGVINTVVSQLTEFEQHIPLMAALTTEGLHERHWDVFRRTSGLAFYFGAEQSTMFKAVLQSELTKHVPGLEAVSAVAREEHAVQSRLLELEREWTSIRCRFAAYQPGEHIDLQDVRGHEYTETFAVR